MASPVPARPESDTAAADRPLAGQHALVTGASRGIGAAIATELVRLGANVTLCARSERALWDFVDFLERDAQSGLNGAVGDVTSESDVATIFERAQARFGAPSILVNNAGGAESAPFAKTDPALWQRMLTLNLTSAYLCTRAAAPAMIAAGWGRIVNVASTAGLKGYAYVSGYVAAKHGLVGLTRALAIEFARTGVTVNAVCPGYTDTPMLDGAISAIAAKTKRSTNEARASLAAANPMGRLITPGEVAAAVGFLCLPSSAAITGETVAIAAGEVT